MSGSLGAKGMPSADGAGVAGRLARFGCVVGLHAGLIGLALQIQPRLAADLGLLRMDVRTIVDEPKALPPKPEIVPPKPPQAQRTRAAPTQPAPPVMTAAPSADASASAFQVAPQPTAPAPAAVAATAGPATAPPPPPQLPITAARFDADYLQNPPPAYPSFSRRLREEGRVLLLVRVSAQGHAESVQVRQSSGFERLDEAALAAVRQWRFVPAKRGDEAITASVIVPLIFRLE